MLNELACDTTVDAPEVGVQVHGGVVTLTGTIASYPKKLAAVDAAHRVRGVRETPDFWAVGQFYRRFEQVTDEHAADLLAAGQRRKPSASR